MCAEVFAGEFAQDLPADEFGDRAVDDDLSPAAGPYDIVATCTVYNSANAQAISVISSASAEVMK